VRGGGGPFGYMLLWCQMVRFEETKTTGFCSTIYFIAWWLEKVLEIPKAVELF
jgi:hypothetical protein